MVDDFLKKKLNIGIFFTNLHGIGGAASAEISFYQQIKESVGDNHQITLLYDLKRNKILTRNHKEKYCNVHLSWFSKVLLYLLSLKLIQEILNLLGFSIISPFEKKVLKNKIDVVISLGINPIINSLDSIPFVTFIWDVGHLDLVNFPEMARNNGITRKEDLYKKNILKARMVLVDSKMGLENILYYYRKNPKMVHVAHFIPEIQPDTYQEKITRKSIAFYPAQFWTHKNHFILIHAIKALIEKNIEPRKIIFTGSDQGNLKSISRLAEELGVSQFVEFRGFVSKAEINLLYKECELVLMPSLLGPTNFPPLEALINGAPGASAIVDGYDERVKNFMIQINPFDVSAWAKMLNSNFHVDLPDNKKVIEILDNLRLENVRKFTEIIDTIAQEQALIKN